MSMRASRALWQLASTSRIASSSRLASQAVLPPVTRHLSTSTPVYKKSKAAAAKKSRSDKDDSKSGHGQYEADPIANLNDVLAKTERKMEKAVDWARGVIYEMVERGRGRVTPALLDSVKVTTPDVPGSRSLNSVASITVSNHALMVNVWDPAHTKSVLSAIHEANLPGLSPNKISETSLKIPVARPSHDQRQEMLKQMGQTVETAKGQVRAGRTDGMNSLGGRGEEGSDEVQKLANDFGGQLDQLLAQAKKEFEKA